MTNKIITAAFLMIAGTASIFGQSTPKPVVNSTPLADGFQIESLETILAGAKQQVINYQEAFKNLLAVETKTFQEFGKNDEVKETTTVESNFLVYQSSKDAKVSSELRSVIKVDGKPVSDSVERSERFFGELQKTTTLKSELDKIQKEGNRYDKTLEVVGLTLYEAVVLSDNLRPYFNFKMVGQENYQGNDVFVVSYFQTKKSPFISFNEDRAGNDLSLDFKFDIPKSLKNQEVFLQGKLWIDAKTFQIRREERALMIQTENPIKINEAIFEYQPSNYEILVPKQISLSVNTIKEKDKNYIVTKDSNVTFNYSEFRKSETDVKILDDTDK